MTTPTPVEPPVLRFSDLTLPAPLVKVLNDVGYETPSPIQAAAIPPLLEGRDIIGQAQTGTGKTAAFALPVLARIDLRKLVPQALVLAPTRELAIQVAEAFQKYATHMPGFHVLPIYGGQSYGPQLSSLRRGPQVIVGTPGRVIDHMDRGTLKLDALTWLVQDEADEMLRMGFIDDVEKILKKTPAQRQVALFSATMPTQIRRIAQTYLKNPAEITIRGKTSTAINTRQRYITVGFTGKLDALTRVLEAEPFDGMIVFARTKQGTVELAEKLEARGFAVAALNGDIEQKMRERTVNRLKSGDLDIIVATDVAARGLDVERISHVINYDIPNDTESYIHRIGRTGRAGRSGETILFITPRERHMLKIIERATRQSITPMELPSDAVIADQRISMFKERITQTLADPALTSTLIKLQAVIEQYETEHKVSARDIAAALAQMAEGDKLLPVEAKPAPVSTPRSYERSAAPAPKKFSSPFQTSERKHDGQDARAHGRAGAAEKPSPRRYNESEAEAPPADAVRPPRSERPRRGDGPETGKETYRVEVGHQHGVKPGNIVGAIANEADLDSSNIGRIQIFDDHSLVDLPTDMPKEIFQMLKKVWVVSQQLNISKVSDSSGAPPSRPAHHSKHKKPFQKHKY